MRWAIAGRIRDLGGNEQVVDEVAPAAGCAVWCLPAVPPDNSADSAAFLLSL